ncbi:MAG: hypothetical protein ACRC2S_28495 [Waterburya sp.]
MKVGNLLIASCLVFGFSASPAFAQSQEVLRYKIDSLMKDSNELIQNVFYSCLNNETIIKMASGQDPYGSRQACADFQKNSQPYITKMNQAHSRYDVQEIRKNFEILYVMAGKTRDKLSANSKYQDSYLVNQYLSR